MPLGPYSAQTLEMSLLLLPLELFREILRLAVVDLGLYRATKLRLVNSECSVAIFHTRSHLTSSGSFDCETLRAYATTELLNLHDICWSARPEVRADFLARYLLQRPHTENRPTNSNFSALINYVVDELVKYDDDGAPEQLRYQYMRTLCHSISRQHGLRIAIYDIFPQTTCPVSSVENRYHVFIAAICLGKSSIVQHMLDYEQVDLTEVQSKFFGTPLQAAAWMGHHDLLRTLLQRGADLNMERSYKSCLPLGAAIRNQDEEMVRLLLEPDYGHVTSGVHFERAIVDSCQSNQPRLAHLLLEHLTDKLSECRIILSDGLRESCRRGMIEIVQLLLDHGGDVNEHMDCQRLCPKPSLITYPAWTGQEEVLRLLLARGANPYGRESGSFESMRAAAWGGHVGATRILLDAGVELKPDLWLRVLEVAAPRVESAEFGRLLLDRGMFDVHNLEDDPQKAEYGVVVLIVLACQQANIGFIRALVQHGVPLNDDLLYARHDCPPPIVAAMAFRQDRVVRLLRELGAKEVDPLDTIWGADFANGKWPRDPPPPPEVRMPFHV